MPASPAVRPTPSQTSDPAPSAPSPSSPLAGSPPDRCSPSSDPPHTRRAYSRSPQPYSRSSACPAAHSSPRQSKAASTSTESATGPAIPTAEPAPAIPAPTHSSPHQSATADKPSAAAPDT